MHGTPLPLYIKHFSTDLRKSQEGSEQKWGGPDPPIPPVATPLIVTSHHTSGTVTNKDSGYERSVYYWA